ncbi:AtpZ/AtpI family protein [Microaerobacter geothermalis]|uniref:AtpZ/AtpI family protein n=1 Tax=Microaerobacter geothermalis TaxID=674972 RepID=UPI001F42ADB6|nr:AtpZ/AtpI family protein [Microaerobacter geothermalis]MCF6093218.1 AtpZ/AtpI family protein [Microaerobacter geothermalis]
MSKLDNPWQAIIFLGTIGLELTVTTLLGFFGGKYLDGLFGTSPIFLIVGVLLGIAAGIYTITLLIKPFLGD